MRSSKVIHVGTADHHELFNSHDEAFAFVQSNLEPAVIVKINCPLPHQNTVFWAASQTALQEMLQSTRGKHHRKVLGWMNERGEIISQAQKNLDMDLGSPSYREYRTPLVTER